MDAIHIDGIMDLKSLVFAICFRNGNTIALYLSTAMARRLRIDTAVETSCKKERPLQRANPMNPPTSHRRGTRSISVICRGTASSVIRISETAMLTIR